MFRHIGLPRPTPPRRGESAACSGQLRSLRGPRAAVSLIPMACIVALVTSGGSGCRPGDQNVSPVTGRVTLDGIPLSGAQVMFLPTIGRPSKGETNDCHLFTRDQRRQGQSHLLRSAYVLQ